MRLISFDVLLQVIHDHGLDETYLALERLFFEEPVAIIDKEGNVLKAFFDEEEIFDYLENIQDTIDIDTMQEL